MALRHGRNVGIFLGGVDLSGDLNAINTQSVQELADVTTFAGTSSTGTAAHSFYPGLAKDTGTIEGFYNSTESAVFVAMVQIQPSYGMMIGFGPNVGDPAYGIEEVMLKTNSIKSVVTDVNRISVAFDTDNHPFEPAVLLSAGNQLVAAASTGTGTAVNNGSASGTTGGAAYLQVFSVVGGTLTVSVQESSSGAYAGEQITTCTFASAATNTTQRIALTSQIRQYARAAWVGATSTSRFALALTRY